MKGGRRFVRATANFRRNLDDLQAFLAQAGATEAFGQLLLGLERDIVPLLERFPEAGSDFLGRAPLSVDGLALYEKVVRLLGEGESLRLLVSGDYVILYSAGGRAIHLLAIRHHRQLSFDFAAHWP